VCSRASLNGGLLEGDAERSMDIWKKYVELKSVTVAFLGESNLLITLTFLHFILEIIVFSYFLFSVAQLPLVLYFFIVVADVLIIIPLHYTLELATEIHLLSQELITNSIRQGYQHSSPQLIKFWESLQSIKLQFGYICSFDSKEFLLHVWIEVIIQTIVNLLLSF